MKGRILVLLTTAVVLLLPAPETALAGEVEWGGPCRQLDKVTYQDTKVSDYLNSIVAVKYDAEALYKLGLKHADAVRSKEAQAALEKLLTIDPDTEHRADIYYQLGYVMYVDERYEDAIVYYDKLIAGYPNTKHHDEALQMEARVYYSLDQKAKCLEVYQVYLDRHPDDPGAMNGFAWFCAKRGFGFDRALPVALKAADLSDRDPGVLDTLAELYFAMGDYDHAIEFGKEALDKEPDDKYFKDQLEKYRKAASEQARR